MNATASLPPEAAAYLAEVRSALSDLPAEERDELLADVEVSLLEAAADGVEPLDARLGAAERFATELRAAAGFAPPTEASAPQPGPFDRLRSAGRRLRDSRLVMDGRRDLAGAWWIARGYLAVVAVAHLRGAPWSESHPGIPWLGGPPALTAAIIVAAIAASVWLGLHTRRKPAPRRWLLALNLVALVAVLPALARIAAGSAERTTVVYAAPEGQPAQVSHLGEAVRNIYPYSRDGRMLFDVLLYDDLGRPLEVGSLNLSEDPLRRQVLDRTGRAVLNEFPIRYLEPGTATVKDPTAAPKIDVPEIVTPALPGRAERPRRRR